MMRKRRGFLEEVALWGGLECTVNRVETSISARWTAMGMPAGYAISSGSPPLAPGDTLSGSLGEHGPMGLTRLTGPGGCPAAELQARGITPIVGLVHHGSGPMHTSLTDPRFAGELAAFAGAVAHRYPWVEYYTPINEPLTTARFSGLYGLWYPHGRDERTFVQALLNQCRAIVLSMRAIRQVNPHAKLVQTDDLGKTYSTPEMAELASFYNNRRWLAWDLLCGKVEQEHPLGILTSTGINLSNSSGSRKIVAPLNHWHQLLYYQRRWLDQRVERYPPMRDDYRDIVCRHRARGGLATSMPGVGLCWRKPGTISVAAGDYGSALGAGRKTRCDGFGNLASRQAARQQGVDIRLSRYGHFWLLRLELLVTDVEVIIARPFDVRPYPTAHCRRSLMQELAAGVPPHPVLKGQGWWHTPGRFPASRCITHAVASLHAIQ